MESMDNFRERFETLEQRTEHRSKQEGITMKIFIAALLTLGTVFALSGSASAALSCTAGSTCKICSAFVRPVRPFLRRFC